MKYFFMQSILAMLIPYVVQAQAYESLGAKATGMGNAVATVSDEWSSFTNIAGIAVQKNYTIGLSYKSDYAIRMFRKGSFHLVGPFMKGGAVTSFYSSGNEVYRLNRISLGYAHKISLVSLGLQMHYIQTSMEGLGVRKQLVFEFGGIAALVPSKLFFGASVFNFNQAKMEEELLMVVMKAGLSYRPGKKVMLNGEIEKDLLYHSIVKVGMEYAVLENFRLRTGINTHPFVEYFGTGFRNKRLQLDYAISLHNQLGSTHQVSLLFFLIK
jgi:hypothetical protein